MRKTTFLCAIILFVTAVGAEEFQVNMRNSGSQANPAVAIDGTGRATIVWSSYYSSSGRSNDIIACGFDATGKSFDDDEFQVNTVREGNQTEPAVAAETNGTFLVAWHSPGLDEEDIFARLFDANSIPVTDEFLVNTATEGQQLYPRIACEESGTFAVVWESRHSDQFGEICSIRGQLFEPNAAPVGAELTIDEELYNCRYPDVAMDSAGRFAVTWLQDRTTNAIMVRLFDPNGIAMTEPLQVNEIDFASVTGPSIAMSDSGDFVIVWDGDPNRASDDDIHARCFDANGGPLTSQFTVNSLCDGAQQWPAVAMDDANDFVVVWQHEHADANIATDIYARRFDATGTPQGDQFKLNGYVAGKQQDPDIAVGPDGAFIAAWESDDQDGSGYGVFALIEPHPPADPNDLSPSQIE